MTGLTVVGKHVELFSSADGSRPTSPKRRLGSVSTGRDDQSSVTICTDDSPELQTDRRLGFGGASNGTD